MATPFLSSEEYDERAHRLYDDGQYDSALETLKEGLELYPHSVELYVGLGYTRIAREEFAWARDAFERGLVLDPDHEDALVGLGDVLLRFGEREQALQRFGRVSAGGVEDLELMLSMGRALYREQLYGEAAKLFRDAIRHHTGNADASAGLAYTLHRQGDEPGARAELARALTLDPEHHEARVYLGHLLYDRGEWAGALAAFERVPAAEQWDVLAVERLLELRRALHGLAADAPELLHWRERLSELESQVDPLHALLSDIEATELEEDAPPHRVVLEHGEVVTGTWYEIVRRIKDATGGIPGETVAQYMQRRSVEESVRTGRLLPNETPQEFVEAGARAGLWQIQR